MQSATKNVQKQSTMFSDNFEARDESPGNDTLIFNPSLIPTPLLLWNHYSKYYFTQLHIYNRKFKFSKQIGQDNLTQEGRLQIVP